MPTAWVGANTQYAMLDHFFGVSTWTAPTSFWLGLYRNVTAPVNAVTTANFTEQVGLGYARVEVHGATGYTFTRSTIEVLNDQKITFPYATGTWFTSYGVFMCAGLTGTQDIYYYGAFTAPVQAINHTRIIIPAGGLALSFRG